MESDALMIASDCRTIGKNTENAGHCGFAVTFFAALIVKDQCIDANNALWRNTGQSYNTGHIRYYKSVILNTGNQKHAIIKTEIIQSDNPQKLFFLCVLFLSVIVCKSYCACGLKNVIKLLRKQQSASNV